MSSEAARVRAWDDEAKLIGGPAKMPDLPKKDDKEQRWNLFLRLPVGVSDSPKLTDNLSAVKFVGPQLAQYDGNNAFGIANVYVGVSEQKDFVNNAFSFFGVSPGGTDVAIPRSPVVMNSVGQALPATISVKQKTDATQYAYSFNFYEHGGLQVAVIFQMDKANAAKADAAIKASLASIGVGDDEAPRLTNVYSNYNRRTPKRK
jgi:hypothetical protein